MCREPQFNQPMNRTAPAGRYVYSRRGKTNPKAPAALNPDLIGAGRHVCRIELMHDKSRKTLWIMLHE